MACPVTGSARTQEATERNEEAKSIHSNSPRDMAPTARVSKVLARAGVCSRREAERWIADGLVRVNGAVIDQVVPVGPKDTIIARGEVVRNPQRTRVWLMHKLRKELVAKSDPKGRRTIYHRLEAMGLPEYVMPVVRTRCCPALPAVAASH